MLPLALQFLCCPDCRSDLDLKDAVYAGQQIETGALQCRRCSNSWPIRKGVPRFVSNSHYADSFGSQWNTFAKTQLDGAEIQESELRFRNEMGWVDLKKRSVVEIGSGAGRFVDVASRFGAELVIGVDITDAVEASYANLKHRDNVSFIQADVFRLPLKYESFDYAYSIGVLHHTPDPQAAFNAMLKLVKVGGNVGVSLYEILLHYRPNRASLWTVTRDLLWAINLWRAEVFRTITTRLPSRVFLLYCKTAVPPLHYLNKVPVLGLLRYLLPCTCYKNKPVGWSMLDTHDTYATKIVHQYRHKDVFQWFMAEGLEEVVVHNSRPGWVSLTGGVPSMATRAARRRVEQMPAPV